MHDRGRIPILPRLDYVLHSRMSGMLSHKASRILSTTVPLVTECLTYHSCWGRHFRHHRLGIVYLQLDIQVPWYTEPARSFCASRNKFLIQVRWFSSIDVHRAITRIVLTHNKGQTDNTLIATPVSPYRGYVYSIFECVRQ